MTAPPATDNRLLNILLVEDDEVDVMNVRRAFQKNHIANPLFVATNGVEALELLRSGTVPKDRRMVLTRITDAGLKLLSQLDGPILHAHHLQLGHLGPEKLKNLLALLQDARNPSR